MNNIVNTYIKGNRSYKKKLIFRIGIDAGFFSEYNNMIITLHYCLVNNFSFILNSNGANFAFKKGWQDYFLPFTIEYNFSLNKFYHPRFTPFEPIRLRDKIGYQIFKLWLKFRRINFLTWQILPIALNQDIGKKYIIPGTELNSNLAENCRLISNRIWRFQPHIEKQISDIVSKVAIPAPYVSFHIRRGDKHKETEFLSLEEYIKKAEELTNIRAAFVATDDYSVYEELCGRYKHWIFHTLCQPDERGYHQAKQLSKSPQKIRSEMLRLFSEIEILATGEYFIGTFSSNISLYLALRMPKERCVGLDISEWRIWK